LSTSKSIFATKISLGFLIRPLFSSLNPVGFLLNASAKKLLVPLMCITFKSYSWSVMIQRVTLLDVKLHLLRKDNALLSEYTVIGCPTTYIRNFCRAYKTASNSCSQVEYFCSMGDSTLEAVDTIKGSPKSLSCVRTALIPSLLASVYMA
jgi:hypothetical protein